VKPVLLIAVNFVREQRWPILVLLLWVLLLAFLGLMSDIQRQREDFAQDSLVVHVYHSTLITPEKFSESRSPSAYPMLSIARSSSPSARNLSASFM